MAYGLGVDLGTTYSAAAVARDGRVEAFSLGTSAPAIPSVVVVREDGEVLVGEAAERRASSEPTRTAREFKRRLGDSTPIVVGRHAVRRRGADGACAARDRCSGHRARGQRARAHRAHPPGELRAVQDRPAARDGSPRGPRPRPGVAAHRARGGGHQLRRPAADRHRPGRGGLRLRRRDVRCGGRAQDRDRLRDRRRARGDRAPRRDRHRRRDPRPRRHGARRPAPRARFVGPGRPQCAVAAARRVPSGQGSPVHRHGHVDPGVGARAARPRSA